MAETIAFAARLVCLSLALAALSRFAFMASGQQVGQRVNWAPFLSNLWSKCFRHCVHCGEATKALASVGGDKVAGAPREEELEC